MTKFRLVCSLAVASIVTFGAVASHAGEADIKYRKEVMTAIGGHMGSIATILKTGAGDVKDIELHAKAMADLAKISMHIFPKNSSEMDGDTKAKMAIWDNPADFKKVSEAFVTEADKLAKVSMSGDKAAIGKQLGMLGKNACKACHKEYKSK